MSKRILIADDHESVLRRVRAILELHPGWEVCGDAVNGREAVTRAVELKPDLVVLDWAMPELNGLEAAEQISNLLPDVPIVLHTMYGSKLGVEAKNHGVSRVVEKGSGALVTAIESCLAQPKAA